ncbi:hypothetical protein MAPG_05942 [Magnaporthiopsis poae ATCC 64411]|uniref:Uncharacterized protein n=1 Tax=Magnaporthiopsis poae (strain ATCC 64411 / 73-15) TaxID=644358 RepID=A0A0C4E0R0_MAGP6|nr:hypothetical protein MAPG_05942 [Magnaporthiopsis poae ATCC 64411]
MKATFVLAALLAGAAEAGNICLEGTYRASKWPRSNIVVFAAGSPCTGGRTTTYGDRTMNNIWDRLPVGVRLCNRNGNLVRIDHGPRAAPGCQNGLEIDGRVYTGDTYPYNPDDANTHRGAVRRELRPHRNRRVPALCRVPMC